MKWNSVSVTKIDLKKIKTNYHHKIWASFIKELQFIEGLRESPWVARVGEEEPPINRWPDNKQQRSGDVFLNPCDRQGLCLKLSLLTETTRQKLLQELGWRCLLVQDDVTLQGSEQLPGPSSVEVQRRQRVASSTRQHQEVSAQGEASPPERVELWERQREWPLTCRRHRRHLASHFLDVTIYTKWQKCKLHLNLWLGHVLDLSSLCW